LRRPGELGSLHAERPTAVAADIGDVDDSNQAAVADDRQVPEMATYHDLGRVTDVCRGLDDGGASGHQFIDPGTVHVLSIGDRVSNVRLGDDAYRMIGPGIQDHQSAHTRALHEIGGRSRVTLLFYRRQRRPHHVCGSDQGTDADLLGHLFHPYLRWDPGRGHVHC
jgi:hypothetical protein